MRSRQIFSEDLMVLSTQTADASGQRPSTAYNLKKDSCNFILQLFADITTILSMFSNFLDARIQEL